MKLFLSTLCTLMALFLFGACNSSGPSITLPTVADHNFPIYQNVQLTLPAATKGKHPITYTLSPSLPQGLTFNPVTRILSGTPTQGVARTTYTLTARDADDSSASSAFCITVPARLAIHTQGLEGSYTIENTIEGGRRLEVTENGNALFSGALSENLPFNLEITNQPLNQTCIIPHHFKGSSPEDGSQPINVYCGTQMISVSGETPLDTHQYISPDGTHILYRATPSSGTGEILKVVSVSDGRSRLLASANRFTAITFTPDGSQVVYIASNENGKALYSAPTAAGDVHRLTDYGHFTDGILRITPDSLKVLYLFKGANQSTYGLYAISTSGGTPTRINETLPSGVSVSDFYISPNGAHVVYAADKNKNGLNEFFHTTLSGGKPFLITPNRAREMSSYTARFTKNSSHFVYWDQSQILSFTTSQKRRSQRISPSLSRQQTIKKTTLTPNGNFVIYHLANNATGALQGIYRVSIGGGSATSLVLPTRLGNSVDTFAISPDSNTLVFSFGTLHSQNYGIYAVPVSGGAIKRLSTLLSSETLEVNTHFAISPDSRHVVYVLVNHNERGKNYNARQVYSVPITGGQSVRLNAPLTSGGIVLHNDTPGLQISPNSSRVVYVASQERAGAFEMYSVPIEGGTPVKVNGTLPSGSTGFGNRFAIAPGKTIFTEGGSRVVYTLIQGQESGKAIYMH